MEITSRSTPILMNGEADEGHLVFADGALVAVLTYFAGSTDTDGFEPMAAGWFLEAGFGPCSNLRTRSPDLFASLEVATKWIYETVASDHRQAEDEKASSPRQ
jgi:hypothetical protein